MKAKLAGAIVLLVATSAEAAPCTSTNISGTFDVQLEGMGYVDIEPPDVSTYTAFCQFRISRNQQNLANLNIRCEPSVPPTAGWGRPFEQDCHHGCPWHQLVRINTEGCAWRLVDRNRVDLVYEVRFAPDRQVLHGRATGSGSGPIEQIGEAVWFSGVKR